MKRTHFLTLIGISALLFTACESNNPSGPIPGSFPKKHLIEEFTGQGCGYCPYGMDCIHDFMANDTNWVLVLHHYGYAKDKFSVDGSKTITNALGVTGAPSVSVNRAKTKYTDEYGSSRNFVVFHPGYFETVNKSQYETTTYASINIANTYDADSRTLKVHVSGLLATAEVPTLHLTVLIKESGMVNTQADYYKTFEGWQEFRHTNAVRAFLSAAKGDEIVVNKQQYSADYSIELNEKWVPENCMVVAFLSEAFKPVVQAEQRPVVAGTQGGADIQHGGITPVPVPDYYPEPNATDGPSTFSKAETDTLKYSETSYEIYQDMKLWTLMAYTANGNITISKTRCIPFCRLYLLTDKSATTIPVGSYELNLSIQAGSAIAGYCDIAAQSMGGCTFYYTGKTYFDQGYLDPYAQWLIADGTLTINEDSWELIGHVLNGADIHLVGSTAIKHLNSLNAPKRL